MNIVTIIRNVIDCRVPLPPDGFGTGPDPAGMAGIINTEDWHAFQAGLELAHGEHKVTVLTLGDARTEDDLRWCLAAGADSALRLWDDSLADADLKLKGQIMAAALNRLGPDLVLCGDGCSDQIDTELPGLAAALAGYGYVPGVVCLENVAEGQAVVVRHAGRGRRERVVVRLPALLAIAGGQSGFAHASADLSAVVGAFTAPAITCWDLSALGIAAHGRNMGAQLLMSRFPVAPSGRIAVPDSDLPATERIRQILDGSVVRKQGELFTGSPEQSAERIFQYLFGESDRLR